MEKTHINIFNELFQVMNDDNVKIVVKKGFLNRNTLIALNSNHLIAFTFDNNDNNVPHDGGTYDTWKKTKHNNKLCMNLNLAI
jgi:hypothetical protein